MGVYHINLNKEQEERANRIVKEKGFKDIPHLVKYAAERYADENTMSIPVFHGITRCYGERREYSEEEIRAMRRSLDLPEDGE